MKNIIYCILLFAFLPHAEGQDIFRQPEEILLGGETTTVSDVFGHSDFYHRYLSFNVKVDGVQSQTGPCNANAFYQFISNLVGPQKNSFSFAISTTMEGQTIADIPIFTLIKNGRDCTTTSVGNEFQFTPWVSYGDKPATFIFHIISESNPTVDINKVISDIGAVQTLIGEPTAFVAATMQPAVNQKIGEFQSSLNGKLSSAKNSSTAIQFDPTNQKEIVWTDGRPGGFFVKVTPSIRLSFFTRADQNLRDVRGWYRPNYTGVPELGNTVLKTPYGASGQRIEGFFASEDMKASIDYLKVVDSNNLNLACNDAIRKLQNNLGLDTADAYVAMWALVNHSNLNEDRRFSTKPCIDDEISPGQKLSKFGLKFKEGQALSETEVQRKMDSMIDRYVSIAVPPATKTNIDWMLTNFFVGSSYFLGISDSTMLTGPKSAPDISADAGRMLNIKVNAAYCGTSINQISGTPDRIYLVDVDNSAKSGGLDHQPYIFRFALSDNLHGDIRVAKITIEDAKSSYLKDKLIEAEKARIGIGGECENAIKRLLNINIQDT